MPVYIQPVNNPKFFAELNEQPLNSECLFAYNKDKGFFIERKDAHYWITRLILAWWNSISYNLEENIAQFENRIREKEILFLESSNKETASLELVAAIKTATKLEAIAKYVLQKRGERNHPLRDVARRMRMKQYELITEVADFKKCSALEMACQEGLFAHAVELIQQGADIAEASQYYTQLLKTACQKRRFRVAVEFIQRGADLSAVARYKNALLVEAIDAKVASVISKLIQSGADCNHIVDGAPILIKAIQGREPHIASLLLHGGAFANCTNAYGTTALFLAAQAGYEALSIELLNHGANPNDINPETRATLFQLACQKQMPALALKMIEKGLQVNEIARNNKEAPMHTAARHLLPTVVQALLAQNASSTICDAQKNTPFHLACMGGMRELAKLFLHEKKSITSKNAIGRTPFEEGLLRRSMTTETELEATRNFLREFLDEESISFILHFSSGSNALQAIRSNPAKEYCRQSKNPFQIAFLLQDGALAERFVRHTSNEIFIQSIKGLKDLYGVDPAMSGSYDIIHFAKYTINKEHLTKGDYQTQIPDKPEGVELDTLLTFYDTINFSRPNDPEYYNPAAFEQDTGHFIFSYQRRAHLGLFIERVKGREHFLGTPDIGSEALVTFHENIEKAVTHCIKFIQDVALAAEAENSDAKRAQARRLKAKLVIEILRAAGYCGGKYYATAFLQYNQIVRGIPPSFEEDVLETLASYREILLQQLVPQMVDERLNVHVDVHDFNQLMKLLGKELGIPGANMIHDFNDRYGRRTDKEAKRTEFFALYTPLAIVREWIGPKIAQEVAFRNQLIDWYKLNVPPEWGMEKYRPIQEHVAHLREHKASLREITEFLKQKEIYFQELTPEEAIEDDRKMAYIALEVIVDMNAQPMRIKPEAIAYMLEKMQIFSSHYDSNGFFSGVGHFFYGMGSLLQKILYLRA